MKNSALNARRTPCVGICSTTYGDLVCRGCKRFAHEIVQWNAFDTAQRGAVLTRLHELRAGALTCWVTVVDEPRLRELADRLRVADAAEAPAAQLAYEVLRRVAGEQVELAAMGLAAGPEAGSPTAREALSAIDREFYARSIAQYERNFHTLAE